MAKSSSQARSLLFIIVSQQNATNISTICSQHEGVNGNCCVGFAKGSLRIVIVAAAWWLYEFGLDTCVTCTAAKRKLKIA